MPNPASPLVYISYRWRGAKSLVDRLAQDLIAGFADAGLPIEVFQDAVSVKPGAEWSAQLQEALARASVLLVGIDPKWVRHADEFGRRRIDDESDWVRLEIERALGREIPVIPLLLNDAELPPAHALPAAIAPLTERQAISLREDTYDSDLPRLREVLTKLLVGATEATAPSADRLPFQVLDLEITNFRCFAKLHVELAAQSMLAGEWTCIAGINGAGKSTVLLALALLLMGPDNARELGGKRLQSLRRRKAEGSTRIRARARHLGEEFSLELVIDDDGPQASKASFWSYSNQLLLVGYGASRNLSEAPDRYDELSPAVRACISLFDPMARLERAEAILSGSKDRQAAKGFAQLMRTLFADELQVTMAEGQPTFSSGKASVPALDLPDGFRSSVAWIADLCVRWASVAKADAKVTDMTGVVMIDEIDLHLHASLQRAIIPRLRAALPRIQFVVTSHSPLILASFDQHELVLLDDDEADGLRALDRQVLGFSPNQIYEWLLRIPASSEAAEQVLEKASKSDWESYQQFADIVGSSPDLTGEEAEARETRIRNRIRKLKR